MVGAVHQSLEITRITEAETAVPHHQPIQSLTLENESGASDNGLSEDNSLFVVATVSDQDGNPHADALLTFTLSNEQLAEFGNDTGTARTNSNGVARLRLNASTASGSGENCAALR